MGALNKLQWLEIKVQKKKFWMCLGKVVTTQLV